VNGYGYILAAALSVCALNAQPVNCSVRIAEDFGMQTRSERAAQYLRDLVGPQAFLYSGAAAAIGHARNRPREWEQGFLGYRRRLGDAYAQRVIGTTLQHGFAAALHEDNRYFNSGKRGFGRRFAYAFTSPFLARHDDGSRSLSVSAIGGVAGASMIGQIWQARSTSEFMPRAVGAFIR
jgi:hypothetical protein